MTDLEWLEAALRVGWRLECVMLPDPPLHDFILWRSGLQRNTIHRGKTLLEAIRLARRAHPYG